MDMFAERPSYEQLEARVAELESMVAQLTRKQSAVKQRRFADFWAVYPNKKGKKEAEKAWCAKQLDVMATQIIDHVLLMAYKDDGWQRGFAPMGSTYINQERWTDEPQAAPRASQPQSAPSKGMQAIMEMEGMKSGRLDEGRNSSGLPAAGVLGLGAPASPGPDAWDRHGLGGGAKPQSGVGSGSGHSAPEGRILDHDG